jgi:hypothetical protein
MRWSRLKKIVEASFAESVKGRVRIYSTRYRCSCGRGWITVDGEELADLSTLASGNKYRAVYHETTRTVYAKYPAVPKEERVPGRAAEPGEFSRFDLHEACWEYVHTSVNDSIKSDNPLVNSLAVLNAKVGKTRLRSLAQRELHPLVRSLVEFRMKSEGIK